MIIAGRIGDIWGHKRLFLVGWIWCGLWSLLAGLSIYSRSIIFFVVCRACQGIGTAITVPVSLAIIGSVYKEGHRKNVAFSIYAAGAPVGFTLGAALSALLAQLAHWPWAYYLAALVCSVLAVVAFFVVPDLRSEIQGSLPSEQLQVQEFDWLGAFTGVSGLVLFNVAWNSKLSSRYEYETETYANCTFFLGAPAVGWQSVQAIAPLTIGFVLSVTFFFVEKRAHQPLVPVEKISKDATWVLLITGMGWSSFGILIYYVVNFLTQLDGDTMLNVSAQLAPIPITGVLASVLASFLLKKGLRTAWLLAIALVWFCVGNTLLATTPIHQTY